MWDKEFRQNLKEYYSELFDVDEDNLEDFMETVSANVGQPQLYILSSRWFNISLDKRREIAKKYASEKYAKDFMVFMNYFCTMIGRFME